VFASNTEPEAVNACEETAAVLVSVLPSALTVKAPATSLVVPINEPLGNVMMIPSPLTGVVLYGRGSVARLVGFVEDDVVPNVGSLLVTLVTYNIWVPPADTMLESVMVSVKLPFAICSL
jgi:hypothetical protein